MTLALIVACKDEFYMVADTRSSEPGGYDEQSPKIFRSKKHQIGLCIAGETVLKDLNNPKDSTKMFMTAHILREFFHMIDMRTQFGVDQLFDELQDFVNQNYLPYAQQFKSDVYLYYGGFLNGRVTIYSWHKPLLVPGNLAPQPDFLEYKASDIGVKLFAYGNYVNVIDEYLGFLVPSSPAANMPGFLGKNELLTNLAHRVATFDYILPWSRDHITKQYPRSVGFYFDYVKFSQDPQAPYRRTKMQVEMKKTSAGPVSSCKAVVYPFTQINGQSGSFKFFKVATVAEYQQTVINGTVKYIP